jgi:hypothetical protein
MNPVPIELINLAAYLDVSPEALGRLLHHNRCGGFFHGFKTAKLTVRNFPRSEAYNWRWEPLTQCWRNPNLTWGSIDTVHFIVDSDYWRTRSKVFSSHFILPLSSINSCRCHMPIHLWFQTPLRPSLNSGLMCTINWRFWWQTNDIGWASNRYHIL